MENKKWFYYGNGFQGFGKNNTYTKMNIPKPKENEMLVRVDAVAICASDIKMMKLGNRYPLFKSRDLKSNPAVLGHELSLTIIQPGNNLKDTWTAGIRVGIQPDVYMNCIRYCVGVNVEGGFQQFMILDESVFHSDYGVTIFPIDESMSFASVAQLEPHACVESAFRFWGRESFDKNHTLLIYIDPKVDEKYYIDLQIESKKIKVVGNTKWLEGIDKYEMIDDLDTIDDIEDLLIIGNADVNIVSSLIDRLSNISIMCWLSANKVPQFIQMDIAKVHYSSIHFIGTNATHLSTVFQKSKRYGYKKNGHLLIMGGAGAMGRIHTLRAILDSEGPQTIVVTARRKERLIVLYKDFELLAKKNHKKLTILSLEEEGWNEKLWDICNHKGFDDVIISAPGAQPVKAAIPYIKKDGLFILFSGTSYGTYENMPLGDVINNNLTINASSGSKTEDEKVVMKKILTGMIDADRNVAAIAGIDNLKEAMHAVDNGDYTGKVIIYPQLENLALIDLKKIKDYNIEFYEYIQQHGWNKQAEDLLYKLYDGGKLNGR